MEKKIKYNPKFVGVLFRHETMELIHNLGRDKKAQAFDMLYEYIYYGKEPSDQQIKSRDLKYIFLSFKERQEKILNGWKEDEHKKIAKRKKAIESIRNKTPTNEGEKVVENKDLNPINS